jgi:hypothetical protein
MQFLKFLVSVFILSVFLLSCKKDEKVADSTPAETNANLLVDLNALVNSTALIPNTKWYTNWNGDSFTVSKFNYYISNIRLKKSDGSYFAEAESYHLIKHLESRRSFVVKNIPEGEYTEIEFMIGIDSVRNISGAQTGDLDPAFQMFWDWNSGYIFYKLEGNYKTLSDPTLSEYAFHIGLFGGRFKTQQICKINLNTSFLAKKNKQSRLFVKVNVEEVFNTPHPIGFDYYNQNISQQTYLEQSENYKDMFVLDRVEN